MSKETDLIVLENRKEDLKVQLEEAVFMEDWFKVGAAAGALIALTEKIEQLKARVPKGDRRQ